MNLGHPRLWIGTFSTLLVGWFAIDALGRTSPGPLSSVHGAVAELEGRRTCAQCHGGWLHSMTESCITCHEPIGEQLTNATGLHGSLGSERGAVCATCHSEHHGSSFAIVNTASFALAGVSDVLHFDHGIVGFEMAGKHLDLACAKCHENAERPVLEKDTSRYLGKSQDCASCHEDVHGGRMQIACADCHSQTSFAALQSKDHERHLSLMGGHAALDCRTCHEGGTPHALEAMGAPRRVTPRGCADCHTSPHAQGFIDGVARLESTSERATCAICHSVEHRGFASAEVTVTPVQHGAAGFPLAEPHDAVGCVQCHSPSMTEYQARHQRRGPNDCRACHGDPHGGQFDTGPFAASGCIGCHARTEFEPHAFTLDHHARTAMPLVGSHAATACERCHTRAADDQPRQFARTSSECSVCHRDAHEGFFSSRGQSTDCARCHDPSEFAQVLANSFDHGRDAGFTITGAHAQAACESCHPRASEPNAVGRSFGSVREQFGSFVGCVTCHSDPHAGRFDADSLPRVIDGRSGCARCHAESSFRVLEHGFDHAAWAGYALVGAHEKAACTACHAARAKPDANGRTWEPARGTQCSDCHSDPHAGQFRTGNAAIDCTRCHAATSAFRSITFDHERDSRFALGEQHRKVACAACHESVTHAGREVVRYRPLPRECSDCHGKNEDPLRRKGRKGR